MAAGYSAEFGRSTGGLVNAITKSGTNRLHGSAFYVNRNRDWPRTTPSARPRRRRSSSSAARSAARSARTAVLLRRLRAAALREHAPRRLQPRRRSRRRRTRRRRSTTTRRSKSRSTRPTTPWRCSAGSTTSRRRRPAQRPLQLQQQQGAERQRDRQRARRTHDQRAVEQRHREGQHQHVRRPVHRRARSNLLFEARGQYSREERPARSQRRCSRRSRTRSGNYGTVKFLPNKQVDWRVQAAANLTWLSGPRTRSRPGSSTTTSYVDQIFGFNQFGRLDRQRPAPRRARDHRRRRHRPRTASTSRCAATITYASRSATCALEFDTDEIAFFAQDAWKRHAEPHDQLRPALGGRVQPDARGQQRLHARARCSGVTFPLGRTVDPTQIPDQIEPVRAARRLRLGSRRRRHDGRARLHGHLLRPHAGAALAAPMNNFRDPARRPVAAAAVHGAGGQPEQHALRAARADRHRPEPVSRWTICRFSRPSR